MADKKLDELVKAIQTYLVSKDVKIIVDGDMGKKTYDAIVKRQGVHTNLRAKTTNLNWRVAGSILTLLAQINAAYPKRDKSGDGTIGDAAHAKRKSDHNAWVRDHNGQPVVTAVDITNDLANCMDCYALVNAIIDDPRVKYMIWAGQIYNRTVSKAWRPYTQGDPHLHHCHISVSEKEELFDDNKPWEIK
jgi:hypothetical protein